MMGDGSDSTGARAPTSPEMAYSVSWLCGESVSVHPGTSCTTHLAQCLADSVPQIVTHLDPRHALRGPQVRSISLREARLEAVDFR